MYFISWFLLFLLQRQGTFRTADAFGDINLGRADVGAHPAFDALVSRELFDQVEVLRLFRIVDADREQTGRAGVIAGATVW